MNYFNLMNQSYSSMKRFEIEYRVYDENCENEYIQSLYNRLIARYERRFKKFQEESAKLA